MIKKIFTTHLKPGMYVVDTGLARSEHPEIYSLEGEIENDEQVRHIVSENYLDAFIDSSKGSFFKNHPEEKAKILRKYEELSESRDSPQARRPAGPRTSKHLYDASIVYSESLHYVKEFIDDLKCKRKINFLRSDEYVDTVLKQLTTDVDSLLFFSKLKTHDKYTYTHNLNVSIFSLAFAFTLGLGTDHMKIAGLSGLFHDIGKLFIDQDIISKPGRLTLAEFEEIKKHPTHGYNILRNDKHAIANVCQATYEHHEKYSGGGYPRNLTFSEISTHAALVSIVDVFDALTSERIYKKGVSLHKALGIIFNLKGSSFTPHLVDRFVRFLGIYPVGSIVVLNTGEKGVVIEQNAADLLRPKIRIVLDEKNAYRSVYDCNLADQPQEEPNRLEIVDVLDHDKCRINVAQFLY